MINRLSNLINRNRSAAKISQVLCSNFYTNDDKDEGDKERKGICSAPGVSRRANQAQTSALPPPAVHHPTFLTDSWLKILFG